jgi:hypothetical protein
MLAIAEPPARPKTTVSIVPAGRTCFLLHFPALRTGYFRKVPAGPIFSNHQRTCTIQIASPYVDAHRRRPDRLRIKSDMRPPNASPAPTALPSAHFDATMSPLYVDGTLA